MSCPSAAVVARRAFRSLLPALLPALVSMPAARAEEIYMRDDGAGGIVFGNTPGKDAPISDKRRAQRAAAASAGRPPEKSASRQELAPLVAAAAAAHGLPEELLMAVVEVESNFNPAAVSPKGAVGLMQLMPQTARQLGVDDPRDPAANLDGGARYLKQLIARFGNDLSLAVAAYNAGPGAVLRNGTIPPYAETQSYVPKVILRYHGLQSGRLAQR